MKRAAIATVATAVGLVLLLGFKSGQAPRVALGSSASAPTSPGPASPGASPSDAPSAAPTSGPTAARTITGQAVQIPFGLVQVRVTVSGRHIENVTALQLPNDNPQSAQISQIAGPMLAQEVLSAQNANINVVSGATYTSEGYAQSLQSALDQIR
jgi:uncharacterized protein with FMN-binding domain